MLIDTDVLICHMRGKLSACDAIAAIAQPHISMVTQMELVQGLRNKKEQQVLNLFLKQKAFTVISIHSAISQRALFLMEEWRLSHGLLMADALIAATAIEHGLTLLTGNDKHYHFIPSLAVAPFVVAQN